MKILQIHTETWDSGISHYALTLSAELKRRGHEVHFWAPAGSFSARCAQEKGLFIRELKLPWLGIAALRQALRQSAIELVNAHTGPGQSLGAALAAGKGLPLVRTRADARTPASGLLARVLARRTQAFVAANTRIQRELARGFPGSRVELIFQGIAEPGPQAPPLPREPVIGVLGRLDPVKGHDEILEAVALLKKAWPKARLLAAGSGRPERRAHLERRAQALGLGGTFEFLGHVPELPEFFARCRIGVVASIGSEAVSRAALEWMAMGRALVATAVGGLPDIVSEGRTGLLVEPGNPQALAAALERLMKEPGLAESLGRAGRERFQERFSLPRFASQTESLYADLLARARLASETNTQVSPHA